jgi:excisionase family DNA binding protein
MSPVPVKHSRSTRRATPPRARRMRDLQGAGEYAQVHPRTIRRWISAGLLTGYRAGPRLIRIDLNELDAMLSEIPTVGTPDDAA